MTSDRSHAGERTHPDGHETERHYREGDAAAWERPIRDAELYDPARRDIYNFIDETKVRYLRPMLPAGGTAIEIGAGSGRLLIRLGLERPYRLVALDYAPYAMRAVTENFRRARSHAASSRSAGPEAWGQATSTPHQLGPAHFVFGDATRLPFPDASFDLVLSGGLLEHFRDPAPVLSEMARVLKPGGLFYADIVPRKVSLYRWAERGRMEREEQMAEGIYESDRSKAAWRDAARAAGVRDVRIVSAGVYPPYTFGGYDALTWNYASFIRSLDGTPVADVLGFFYMVTGTK